MNPQAAFIDGDVGPNPRHQIPLAYNLRGRGNQGNQNVERAPAQFYGDALFGKEPLAYEQLEWTKRYAVFGLTCGCRHGVFFLEAAVLAPL